MSQTAPPQIFAPARRLAARRRALALQARPGAARYLLDDMVEDVLERLAFLRHQPATALVIGDWTGSLARALSDQGCTVTAAEPAEGFVEEAPYPETGFDLITSLIMQDQLRHSLVLLQVQVNTAGTGLMFRLVQSDLMPT